MKKTFLILLVLITRKSLTAQTTTYEYDKLYRLTKITYSNGSSIAYQYDANGNRVLETRLAGSIVPVRLVDFLYQQQACNEIKLVWQTAQEINNAGFEIEQSNNGIAFSTIAFVAGAGNSNQPRQYQHTLQLETAGVYYFRLRQIDKDGRNTYSKVLQYKQNCDYSVLKIVPNPAQTQVFIKGLDITKPHTIEIFNASGTRVRQMLQTKIALLDISALPQGFYIIAVDNKTHLRLIKQ